MLYIPAFCMALHEGTGMSADKNNARRPSTTLELQENKNDIVGNKILHCGKLMDMFNKLYKEHGQNEH
jgi:hypothetical protein